MNDPNKNDLWTKAAYGALAGVVATLAVQGARVVNQKVAHRKVRAFESDLDSAPHTILPNLPKPIESAGAAALQYAYGPTGTAIYTALRSDSEIAIEGAALGAAVWAAGRFGWIPDMGLAPKGDKPGEMAASLAQHLLFGIATIGAYRKLRTPTTA